VCVRVCMCEHMYVCVCLLHPCAVFLGRLTRICMVDLSLLSHSLTLSLSLRACVRVCVT
jgi:hypothetical protein